MSTVHCGNLCVGPGQQGQQYPGAPGAPPPLVHIGGGTLPFTGAGFEVALLVLVAVVLALGGLVARRIP